MYPDDFVVISKEAFFTYVGPRNISPYSTQDKTLWSDENRRTVGVSTQGWKDPAGEKTYQLRKEFLNDEIKR